MIGTVLKAIAYSQAPRATFSALHPSKAVRLKKMQWDMKHAYAPRISAVGAALLALPIGLLIGRFVFGRHTLESREPRVHPGVRRTGWPDEVNARTPSRGAARPFDTAAQDATRTATRPPAGTTTTTARATATTTPTSTTEQGGGPAIPRV